LSGKKADAQGIKKEYVRSMFVDAVKAIITRDGATGVTARKIAEMTGYSYATVYYYFSDLNALLLETKLAMIRDMLLYGKEHAVTSATPLMFIKAQARFPVDYFLEHPHIFRFLHAHQLDARNEEAMRSLEIEKEYWDDYLPFVENGVIQRSDIPIIARTIMYAVYGMITLCLSGNGLQRDDVYRDMDNMIDLLLKEGHNNEKTE
jgi:AcrR family transcriptional regulator